MRKDVAYLLAIGGGLLSLAGIAVATLAYGVDERSTPIIVMILGTFGTILATMVSAVKATEAADKSGRSIDQADAAAIAARSAAAVSEQTARQTELTASKASAIQQLLAEIHAHLQDGHTMSSEKPGGTK
jgi:hypothetical protein